MVSDFAGVYVAAVVLIVVVAVFAAAVVVAAVVDAYVCDFDLFDSLKQALLVNAAGSSLDIDLLKFSVDYLCLAAFDRCYLNYSESDYLLC